MIIIINNKFRRFPLFFQFGLFTFTSEVVQLSPLFEESFFDEHHVKSVCIQSFSGLYFHAFVLNMDEKNSEYGHFFTQWNSMSYFLTPVHDHDLVHVIYFDSPLMEILVPENDSFLPVI